jgi:alpha-L-rhamnosidase
MEHPTWPTEWAPHMVFMAHADWMHTGDAGWLKPRYESLKSKLLLERAGEDGLIRSNARQIKRDDIVDWPKGERDGYVFREVNTVVNAFHIEALRRMADLAVAVGEDAEAKAYRERADKVEAVFRPEALDEERDLPRRHRHRPRGVSCQHVPARLRSGSRRAGAERGRFPGRQGHALLRLCRAVFHGGAF